MLHFYFNVDGEKIEDFDEWALKVNQLFYALDFNGEYQQANGSFKITL